MAFNTGSRTAPNDLVQGPDGNMWFTSIGAAKGIGHIRPDGKGGALTALSGYAPVSLTFGRDGAIYATDAANNVILRTSPAELQVTNVDPGEGSVLLGSSPGKVKAGKKPLPVTKNALGLKLACPADAAQGCAGQARLTTNAKKKAKVLSQAKGYKIKAGTKGTLKLKLNKRGLKALKKGKTAKVRLELLSNGTVVATKVLKVRRR